MIMSAIIILHAWLMHQAYSDTCGMCLGSASNITILASSMKCLDPEKYCRGHWSILTVMALETERIFYMVAGNLDPDTATCTQQDQSFFISPTKLLSNDMLKYEPFYHNYFTNQTATYPWNDILKITDAGDIIAEMFYTTLIAIGNVYVNDNGGGGIANIFLDVPCLSLCTNNFCSNQATFIEYLAGFAYIVNIYYLGDVKERSCITTAFSQCGKYNKTNCQIHFLDPDAQYDLYQFCAPYKFPILETVLICVGILLFLLAVILTVIFLRYRIKRGKHRKFWVTVSGFIPITAKIDEWELGEKQLEIFEEKELGRGAFAIVFEGQLTGTRPVDRIIPSAERIIERKNQVAVKRLPPHADDQARQDFMAEIVLMKKLGYHPHILGMIGCITTSNLPLIVLDYCENGDLLSWVRKQKYSQEMGPKQFLSIAWQISDGLCYMKSINLLHRDLAARNVLLTKELVAKISDFGLAREPERSVDSAYYFPRFYVSRGGRLPVKWMAPESLRGFQFSFKTDIWSYGILLWEMYTFGDVPFAAVNAPALLEVLESGERLPQGGISDQIYNLMTSCWESEPERRETIEKIKEILNGMLTSSCNNYGYLTISADCKALEEEKIDEVSTD